jgi:hypothetical protein
VAITHNQTQVKWSTANTVTVNPAGNATSDAFTFNTAAIEGMIQVKTDNTASSPASDAQVDIYVLYCSGDPDADPDSVDEFDDSAQAIYLGQLDTYTTGTGSDPARRHFPISVAAKSAKLYVENLAATNNTQTVSAQFTDIRG